MLICTKNVYNSLNLCFAGSRTAPISLGVLKNLLNVEASSESRHRTLYISRAEPKLSGEYTCKVSTLASDDQMSKTMLVFGKSHF